MPQSDTRSLHEIRRDTEQSRAALTTSVEELRGSVTDTATDIKNRLRPEAIKAEVSGYIKTRGEQLLHDITEMARRNPMQAVAIGASVAYPAMRLARAIPLPVLMIGAGLFLAGSKTGRDLTQKVSDYTEDLSEEARSRANELGDQMSQAASEAKNSASDLMNRTGQTLADAANAARSQMETGSRALQDGVGQTMNGVNETTAATTDKMSQAARSSARAAQQAVSSASEFVRDAGARAAQSGQEFLDMTSTRASRLSEQTTETVWKTVQQNPLLVAGLGLLIGGLIASALPRSEIEENLAGSASEAVKRRAGQAAAAGFEAAKGAAGEIVANAAQQASAEGLTPEDLAQDAEDVGHRVQRVAERAVTTAFDPDQQSEDTGGERQHG